MSRHILAACAGLVLAAGAARAQSADTVRERAEAAKVTITRDSWGIAHVRAPTDALAVFGGVYAQGQLREVYFWPDQLRGHIERVYHPGE